MHRLIYWLAPLYTAAIVIASLIKNPAPPINVTNVDKIYHVVAYLIMALVWYFYFYTRYLSKQSVSAIRVTTILKHWSRTIAIGSAVFSLLVGVLVEFGQEYIAVNRTMEFMDVLANIAGIILASLLLLIFDKIFNKQKTA
ncbi:MAG: VanZ family protein [Nonlabens sp.]|jgi:VanZ family protein